MCECAEHQVTKELTWETNYSGIHARVYASYHKSLGQDVEDRAVIKALMSKRSTLVQLASKERRVFGPIDVEMKVDFVHIYKLGSDYLRPGFGWADLRATDCAEA